MPFIINGQHYILDNHIFIIYYIFERSFEKLFIQIQFSIFYELYFKILTII